MVLQMGLEHRIKIALRFALAVAIVEYPYAWIAVEFEQLITSSPVVLQNLSLWGAISCVSNVLGASVAVARLSELSACGPFENPRLFRLNYRRVAFAEELF